jgi:hypothetical protein
MIAALLLMLAPVQDEGEKDLFEWARKLDELDLTWRWGGFQFEASGQQDLEFFLFGDEAPGVATEDPALRDGDYERDHRSDSPEMLSRTQFFLDVFYGDWLEASFELKLMGTTGAEGDFAVLFEQYWVRAKVPETPELNFQLGKFAAPLGNFIPRSSSRKNPLATWPLMYDLPTALVDPGTTPEGLRSTRDQADLKDWVVPVWREVYGTGVMTFGGHGDLSWQVALMNSAPGTLMDEWDGEAFDPDFQTLYLRTAMQLDITTQVGLSWCRGPYAKSRSYASLPGPGPIGSVDVSNIEQYNQTMFGADASYAMGYLELFAEVYWIQYEAATTPDLDSWTWYVEGKYTILPGLWAAARIAQMIFEDIGDPAGKFAWDRGVNRFELGGGYLFTDNFFAKLTAQFNFHAGGPEPSDHMLVLQVGLGF